MKPAFILCCCMLPIVLAAQYPFIGQYHDFTGRHIKINADGRFQYIYYGHMMHSWTNGVWTTRNDTIFLQMEPVYDTARYMGNDGKMRDSLLLSDDTIPGPVGFPYAVLCSQNALPYPEKLITRHKRLYRVEEGKLVRKKERSPFTGKKFPSWFIKESAE